MFSPPIYWRVYLFRTPQYEYVNRPSSIVNRKLNLPPPRISFIISFSAIINEEYPMPLLTQNRPFYGGLKRIRPTEHFWNAWWGVVRGFSPLL
jgi:hypothetical protein